MPHIERALELSERLRLNEIVVEALINKSLALQFRPNESLGLMRQALLLGPVSGGNDTPDRLRAFVNFNF